MIRSPMGSPRRAAATPMLSAESSRKRALADRSACAGGQLRLQIAAETVDRLLVLAGHRRLPDALVELLAPAIQVWRAGRPLLADGHLRPTILGLGDDRE